METPRGPATTGADGGTPAPPPPDEAGFSVRRVVLRAILLATVGAFAELFLRNSIPGAASLTVAAAVAIINFRSLEGLLQRVVQPGRPRFDRRSVLTIVGRLALLGGGLAALLIVPGIDFVAVALGVSTLVASLIVEGLRRGVVGGG
ncbi:MAG TPA: hypothetical protein PKJ99_09225 [Thermoanaerobaculales bacterium]|nr:hypothetical protein [Thermoanaerobaculales bacterium]HPA82758.1 hypothetical protein [Thermoanaerobaculales bacterium]HQL30559.1 hypothetical protein [Thermoanaerobaculales bacterium]HQP43594.1 hypothetical protein [Thermoanaerobaculales bacterium]